MYRRVHPADMERCPTPTRPTLDLAADAFPARRRLIRHRRLECSDCVHKVASALGAHVRVSRARGRNARLNRVAKLCRLLGE